MTSENLSLLNLEYSFINEPTGNAYYQSSIGLWNEYINEQGNTYRLMDNLIPIHHAATKINMEQSDRSNYISVTEPQLSNQMISVCFNGSQRFIAQARMKILQTYNQVHFKTIQITKNEFMTISQKFTDHLADICRQYQVEMIINDRVIETNAVGHMSQMESASNNDFYIHIIGNQDNITVAEPSIRILISNILNGEYLDSIEIELSLIPLIGGIDFFNFNQIAKQTNANIYIPDLLPNLFNSNVFADSSNLRILFTAKTVPQLLLTKHILTKLINDKRFRSPSSGFLIKEIPISKAKIDTIVLYNQSEILKIMFKHGVFVQLPSLGEPDNFKIVVQGCTLESVNEAVDEICLLCTNFYTLKATGTGSYNEQYLLHLIQLKKTCTINANSLGFEINGTAKEIKQVISQLATPNSRNPMRYGVIKLRLELSINQRDFISGKKNGKLIKILNQLNQLPMIKFKPFNEFNFFIDIEVYDSTDLSILAKGVELIELELPSELQFNIPEVFHKSIIGNGGSIIQSIMKKYNVFIKFSSSVSESEDDYSFKRFNNVLIRCPRKNSKNINLVKYEIDQLVYQCWNSGSGTVSSNVLNFAAGSSSTTIYHTAKFQLLKSHYLLLVNNNKLNEINKLESANSSFINFPTSIDNFGSSNHLTIDIKGSEIKSKQCVTQLASILPKNYEFKITFMPGKFEETFGKPKSESGFFDRIAIPFKILLNVELIVNEYPTINGGSGETYHQIILSYYNDQNLESAIHELTSYLREKGFLILDKKEIDFDPVVEVDSVGPIRSQLSSPNKATMFSAGGMVQSPVKGSSGLTSPVKAKVFNPSHGLVSPVKTEFNPLVPITNKVINGYSLAVNSSKNRMAGSPRKGSQSPRKSQNNSSSPRKQQPTPVKPRRLIYGNLLNSSAPIMNPNMIHMDGDALNMKPMDQYVPYIA